MEPRFRSIARRLVGDGQGFRIGVFVACMLGRLTSHVPVYVMVAIMLAVVLFLVPRHSRRVSSIEIVDRIGDETAFCYIPLDDVVAIDMASDGSFFVIERGGGGGGERYSAVY